MCLVFPRPLDSQKKLLMDYEVYRIYSDKHVLILDYYFPITFIHEDDLHVKDTQTITYWIEKILTAYNKIIYPGRQSVSNLNKEQHVSMIAENLLAKLV